MHFEAFQSTLKMVVQEHMHVLWSDTNLLWYFL